MESEESKQLESEVLRLWHQVYSTHLTAFLIGLLKNRALAEEAVQSTFTKALLSGGEVQAGSEKSWLFRVAYNEAMLLRRREGVHQRAIEHLAHEQKGAQCGSGRAGNTDFPPVESLLRLEVIEQVQQALLKLPEELKLIVEQRIYHEKTFQCIANEFQLPLGTVLTRMRTALQQLQSALRSDYGHE